jgi:hypothetical protein
MESGCVSVLRREEGDISSVWSLSKSLTSVTGPDWG